MADENTPDIQGEILSQDTDIESFWHDLLFGVRRSVRYHNRRRRFFDNVNRWKTALTLLAGSAAMVAILGKDPQTLPLIASAFVTVVSTLDLVLATIMKARLHADLARRFLDLERAMILVKNPTADDGREYTTQRLIIEAEEPPILRVLDVLCHNELMLAMGYTQSDLCFVPWYKRLLAPCLSMSAEGLQTIGEREAQQYKRQHAQREN
jgi:hypothetical protein